MTKAGLTVVLAALLVLAGCGEQEDVSPSFEDRIPAGLELESAERSVIWGDKTVLSGALDRDGEPLAGEKVTLEEDPYPFEGRYRAIESAETDADGAFSFEAAPDRNTAYRVAAGELSETTSSPAKVYVLPRISETVSAIADGVTVYETTFEHADDVVMQGSTLLSYAALGAGSGDEIPFVGRVAVEQVRQGLSRATFELEALGAESLYETCVSYVPDSGLGLPGKSCSQSSVVAK